MSNRKIVTAWIPRDTAERVLRRVEEGGFVSVSDYLRSLIREDLEREGAR